ncbi:hypothetical protein Tco_1096035 [Tanacetum coccineum]
MDNSKRDHIPMQERLDLYKTQGASTPKEVKRMQNVPYALSMGSIMYAVWICQILQEISQKRTRERMSDQEAKEIKAEAREIMPQPSTVNCS